MFYYQIDAELVIDSEHEAVTDDSMEESGSNSKRAKKMSKGFIASDEWNSFKEFAQQYSEEFYQESGNETYIFTAGIYIKEYVRIGVISRNDLDITAIINKYLKLIDTEFRGITTKEITLASMHSMLDTSEDHGLINDHGEVLELFGLRELSGHSGRYDRGMRFKETVLSGNIKKQCLIDSVRTLLCGETLIPEIERIYQIPADTARTGHPVHYVIQTNDSQVREQITTILLSALYANRRIRSRRYSNISFNTNDELPTLYDKLYRSNVNNAVVVNYCGSDENDDEYAKPDLELISGLCDAVKKYKNKVLTILCLPRASEKTKNLFIEDLGSVTLIPLTEETVFGDRAKKYLRQLAKKQNVSGDKALYKTVTDVDRGYLAADLNIAFDDWYGKKLKMQIFPQYADFESASSQVVGKKPKGSAYSDLDKMIGLPKVKEVISNAIDYHKAQKLFKDKGLPTENVARHMVFAGNPGTAKTTAARLFAQIMKDNGLLSEGRLYEVGRADLVGKYVGWTAQIVKKKFRQARGSVLFIDEAYSLVDDKDGLFGDEAINTIVQEMENNREDMVVIFAGYPDKMEAFLQKNPGLRSRIAFHVPFSDYNPEELYQITKLLAEQKKMTLASDVEDKLLPIFETHIEQENFGNGRFARNLLEKAQLKQASRLIALNPENVTKSDVITLIAKDFEAPEQTTVRRNVIGFV